MDGPDASPISIVDVVATSLRAAGCECEVTNFGQTMTTTCEGLARVRHRRAGVDVALINYGLVDSWVTSLPRLYVPYYPDSRARRWARKLLKHVKRRLRSERVRRWIPTGTVVPLDDYERHLRRMVSRLRAARPEVVIVFWSTAHVLDNPARNANIDRYNARMRRIAFECRCVFIETQSVLHDLTDAESYRDSVHLSRAAIQRLGAAIGAEVLSRIATRTGPTPHRDAA
jgi:lysophospholipase L1-like esterase